ncbi:hypothetical protein BJX62DRAFT_191983 [Aspergillus germanicus]
MQCSWMPGVLLVAIIASVSFMLRWALLHFDSDHRVHLCRVSSFQPLLQHLPCLEIYQNAYKTSNRLVMDGGGSQLDLARLTKFRRAMKK